MRFFGSTAPDILTFKLVSAYWMWQPAQAGPRVTLRLAGPASSALIWRLISSRPAEARLTIDFRVGDAEVLPFDAHSVDAVISTFGVMFVSNPGAAVAELARVCKRGGRLGLATWPADGTVAGLCKILQPYMRGVEAWSKQTVAT